MGKFFNISSLFFCIASLCSAHVESSYPYISGYTWWHFCDYKLTHPDYGKSIESRFNPEKVETGDTIFVEYDCLDEFAHSYLPKLTSKVILITANYGYHADMPLPGPYAFLLDDEKIIAWFVQNIDRAPTTKLIPMPIGLASNYWPHGDNVLVQQAMANLDVNQERSIFIYLNFSMSLERMICANHFTCLGVPLEPKKSYAAYLEDLSKTVFVVSPPGGGVDCHRTWEALLLGCYPILQSSFLDPLFEDLPCIIIQNWKEVTPEFLERQYNELRNKTWNKSKLYISYWFSQVRALQFKSRSLSSTHYSP